MQSRLHRTLYYFLGNLLFSKIQNRFIILLWFPYVVWNKNNSEIQYLFLVMGRTPFHGTLNELEHHFSNIERTQTCSSIGDWTPTLYFWHRTNIEPNRPSLDLLNFSSNWLECQFFEHRTNLNMFIYWYLTRLSYFWLRTIEHRTLNIIRPITRIYCSPKCHTKSILISSIYHSISFLGQLFFSFLKHFGFTFQLPNFKEPRWQRAYFHNC